MMPGQKTNEAAGTRAVLRYSGMSAFKVRQVVDQIRGRPVHEAADVLRFTERAAARVVEKLLHSAVANASNNEGLDPDELYVSACFADEGPTAKRWRPRARGRATRIRKRSCHVTLIVSRLPEPELRRLEAHRARENLAMRARRVEATRRARAEQAKAEAAEGASRAQRRHPGAAPAAEGAPEAAEGAPEEEARTERAPEEERAPVEGEALPEAEAATHEAGEGAPKAYEGAPEAEGGAREGEVGGEES
jgi:large subunit ribosomal protein L22